MMPFIAVDWGTTNRRAYRIDGSGLVQASVRDECGAANIAPGTFAGHLQALRDHLGDLPALCAGMVGSSIGWQETPYVACPLNLSALAAAVTWVEAGRTAIVPGAFCERNQRADVMRGEEVQMLGAVQSGLASANARLCQPGTHSKWGWVGSGNLNRFVTAFTGELFSLLRQHSLLRSQLSKSAESNAWFVRGLRDAGGGELLARLFGVRADAVSGSNRIGDPASYVSGLLIGSEVAARDVRGNEIVVIADRYLGSLYAAAVDDAGGKAILVDSEAAFVAGARSIWSMIA